MHQVLLRENAQRVEYSVWWNGMKDGPFRGYLGATEAAAFGVREATGEERKAARRPVQQRHIFVLPVERVVYDRQRKQSGLCPDCGAQPAPNRTRCRPCLIRAAARNRESRVRMRAARQARIVALQQRKATHA